MAFGNVCLLLTVVVIASAEDNFGLDKTTYDALITEEYSNGGETKEDIFVKHMWSKIAETIPSSVITPGHGVNYNDGSYDCITETRISPRLGNIIEKKATVSGDKIKLEILSEWEIVEPMSVDYVMKYNNDDKPLPLSKFKFAFQGQNKVKLNLEIPAFSQDEQNNLSERCLVTIEDLEVTAMVTPNMDKCEEGGGEAKELADIYWKVVSNKTHMFSVMSIGLITGIDKRLKEGNEFWVCRSDEFQAKIKEIYKNGFTYSDNYNNYCHGVRVQDD